MESEFLVWTPLPLHSGYTVGFAASRGAVKKISEQQRIGQQGVHLLGARLLSVGLTFQPNGPLDAGIDGFLELRDPATGEVRAQWITAQLKTQKEGRLTEETDESFSYLCRKKISIIGWARMCRSCSSSPG